ncbi:MAG: UbiA family prenyltransferase [Oscillospiraceae bacterium]|jgi:4-hydroxybenzoate polyprenyltransferase|nr:UbiA family prenyltransferase [Oscillospiraceae bacterium]
MLKYVKIARPDHWIKNIFMLPGLLFAYITASETLALAALPLRLLLGGASLCLLASANYVINEYLDAAFDKYHPTKKARVAVRTALNPALVYAEYAALALAGLALGYFCGTRFLCAGIFLLVMGFLYNVKPFRTKDAPYLDVLSESVNNAIRLAMGWFLVSPGTFPMSSLIIGYWMGGAFLMAVKRYSEYRFIADKAQAALYRKSFRVYTETSLLLSGVFYAMISLFFIGIFIIKYRIEYIFLVPFISALFCWYLYLGMQHDSVAQKPEKLYKQWRLFLYLLFIAALGVALTFVRVPFLEIFL